MTPARDVEQGVILINVLVILALSSTIVFAMLRLSDTGVSRSQRYSEAGQAFALIDGAEATAIAALRRDMRDAPLVDHPAEDWAGIAQDQVAIEGGSFSLTIHDAAGKFNLTNLAQGQPQDVLLLQKILTRLEMPDTVGLRILARMANPKPLNGMDDLLAAGLDADTLARLSALVTVLPKPTAINLNAMPDAMFAVLAANPVQARLLQGIRERQGQLSASDLLNAGLILGAQVSEVSAFFSITTRVSVGGTTVARESLLMRAAAPEGALVTVVARTAVP